MNRNGRVAAIAAVVVVGALLVFFVSRGDNNKKKPPKLPAAKVQLDTGGVALASLLRSARDVTYHAKYTASSSDPAAGGTTSLEAWNTKGRSRVDTTLKTPDGQVVRTASILDHGKAQTCSQPPKQKWACQKVDKLPEGDAAGLAASIDAKLEGRSVTERADKVHNIDARCFQLSAVAAAEALDVCVNSDGVLLRLKTANSSIELADLDKAVPDSAFDAPT